MKRTSFILVVMLIALPARSAFAVKIADITRLSGERSNVITGLGLVVGLKGTGDGGDFAPAIRPLAAMLAKLDDKSDVRELSNAVNVALVSITAVLPASGFRSGDKIDVHVTSIGAAGSLKGGWLFTTPLMGPMGKGLFAMAQGAVVIEDPSTPTHGIVPNGGVLEADHVPPVIEKGRITLIIDEPSANWTTASVIAKIINDAEGNGELLAIVVGSKNVVVMIPANERERPDSFIARIQRLPVPLQDTEARVLINEKTGTIILTGDVEISPVAISHKGLTITTTNPPPQPTPRTPVITEKRTIGLDTTSQGGPRLQELIDAMDLIRVPAEDRIAIIKELHKTGKLHAKLILSGQNE